MQIGIAGGGLRHEIRIPASNTDLAGLHGSEAPPEELSVAPYLVTFYVDLGGKIVATPPANYFPGARPLLHYPLSGPERDWQAVDRSLARIFDETIAAARAGRFRGAHAAEATVYSWPLLASWAVPLAFSVAFVARRGAIRNARRLARAAPA